MQQMLNDKKPGSIEKFFNNKTQVPHKNINISVDNIYFCAWNLTSLSFNEKLNYHLKKCLGVEIGNHYLDNNIARNTLGRTKFDFF